MSWLRFALLAPVLDTIILYIDRYVIEREVRDYRGMVVFGGIVGFLAGTIYWVVAGFPILSLRDATIVIVTGLFLSERITALQFGLLVICVNEVLCLFLRAITFRDNAYLTFSKDCPGRHFYSKNKI